MKIKLAKLAQALINTSSLLLTEKDYDMKWDGAVLWVKEKNKQKRNLVVFTTNIAYIELDEEVDTNLEDKGQSGAKKRSKAG